MDKQSAATLVKNTFNYQFDEGKFQMFIRNLFDDLDESKQFEYHGTYIPDSFKKHIKKYKRLGKYLDPHGNKLDVITVNLQRESALERARTMQRNFIAWYLKNRGEKDAAVVAYYTDIMEDWRFSFVHMEYKQKITESGKIRIREGLTPARRYSFLVGKNEPNHTAQEQIVPILLNDKNNPSIEDLENAFSVEVVTKRFYTDYRRLFEKLVEELYRILGLDTKVRNEFTAKFIDTANFAKKLLGQIVFLYFLQKKGWLGVGRDDQGNFKTWGTGPKNFLRRLFEKEYIDYKNFFNDVLEPIFYIALATEKENDYYDRLDCKIPFLNGGLFEPINGYNWQETDILISNGLFSEVFDTFDRYNFTVREDEPLEKEVAVDPEMLGKVFENLLPENLRKGKGTYYTPREIVHFMCQESLINYLDTTINHRDVILAQAKPVQKRSFGKVDPIQTPLKTTEHNSLIQRKDIVDFVRKGEFAIEHDTAKEEGTKSYKYKVPESIRNYAKLVDEKLKGIKVCDPAVGSGAFLVGMMHEVIKARNVLTVYLNEKIERTNYNFKRHCIQESIYGVDIDPGAIDIAKLRLWLSLVMDEEDYLNIKPLPNLDYKIMQGNSLIEDFHRISLDVARSENGSADLYGVGSKLDRLIEDLHKTRNDLFNAAHPGAKERLKQEVEEAIVKIFHFELERQKEPYFRELKRIEETAQAFSGDIQEQYKKEEKAKLDKKYEFDIEAIEGELREMTYGNKVRNFFPWKLYFADVYWSKGGFDLMIANPPYIFARDSESKGISGAEKEYFYKRYKLAKYQINTYPLFIELAHMQLKHNGILTFITPNNWLTINTTKDLRKFILNQSNIVIVNFYAKVFESANVDSSIIICEKSHESPAKISLFEYEKSFKLIEVCDTDYFKKQKDFIINIESLKNFEIANLLSKIESKSIILGSICDVKAGLKAYEVGKGDPPQSKEMKENRIYHSLVKENEKYFKYLHGKDVSRYYLKWSGEYLKYGKNLAAPRGNFKLFSSSRILVRQIPSKPPYSINACYTDEIFLNDLNSMNIINIRISPCFILGVLNSKLITFWFLHKFGKLQRGLFPQFKVNELRLFPIPDISSNEIIPVVDHVKKILDVKKSHHQYDTSALEAEVDQMVYELYGLTEEEIAVVEKSVRR